MERVSAQCCCIPYTVIEIIDGNCNDLELDRFKVMPGQRSLCQSKAHMGGFLFEFHWLCRRICHRFRNIWRVISMTLLAGFKVIEGQRWWMPIESPLMVSHLTSIGSNVVSRTVFEIVDAKILGRFKVIQGQRSWSQWKAHVWFPIWPPMCPTLYLAPYSRYLMPKSCNL